MFMDKFLHHVYRLLEKTEKTKLIILLTLC